MIRHIVLVRFRPEVTQAEKAEIHAGLAGLQARLPGFLRMDAGPNASPEGLGQGFADGFVIDFSDAAARDAYLADAEHQALGARLVAAAQDGLAGLLVFDLALG